MRNRFQTLSDQGVEQDSDDKLDILDIKIMNKKVEQDFVGLQANLKETFKI